jgi:hypothetical protein
MHPHVLMLLALERHAEDLRRAELRRRHGHRRRRWRRRP